MKQCATALAGHWTPKQSNTKPDRIARLVSRTTKSLELLTAGNTPLALSVYKVKPPAEGDNMYLWVESSINGDTLIMGSMLYYKLYGIGIKSSDF